MHKKNNYIYYSYYGSESHQKDDTEIDYLDKEGDFDVFKDMYPKKRMKIEEVEYVRK
ncbi:MAG: hypothetical protein PHG24_01380 [Candidatus Pacebacteria bacterium]|nr:hypothetical protein [Candidatus Paceibacterota bacterium]